MDQNQAVTNSEEQGASWIRMSDPSDITSFDIKQRINGERIQEKTLSQGILKGKRRKKV